MISMLKGTVAYHGIGFVFVNTGSVGYKVTVPESVAHGLSGEVTLYTHEVIRDDGRELFGFTSIEALELSWKLTSVSGVGPKLAQKIVYGSSSAKEVAEKIDVGDVDFLFGISGVGKKTAQKIVLELHGKMVDAPAPTVDQDALAGLMGLGYSKLQAEEVLSALPAEVAGTEARLKEALKQLGLNS